MVWVPLIEAPSLPEGRAAILTWLNILFLSRDDGYCKDDLVLERALGAA